MRYAHIWGRVFQTEGTAKGKVLQQECAGIQGGCVIGAGVQREKQEMRQRGNVMGQSKVGV